jgi:hypothetical protein
MLTPLADLFARLIVFGLGAALVGYTLMSAIRAFVLPRGDNVPITRYTFRIISRLFIWRANKANSYEGRDRVMALFAPVTLLVLPVIWIILIILGYMLMYWALGVGTLYDALKISGSSLLTLGFFTNDTLVASLLEFSEATIGLGIVALLISYLPTMYTAFSKRETLVTMLEVRADSPPSAVTMISRAQEIRGLEYLDQIFEDWEIWFAELEESHTSLAPVNFFRSPQPDRSWITAAGAVLDCAALMNSTVDVPRTAQGQIVIRAGFVALRHVCDFFQITYHPDPRYPAQPISIAREEWEEARQQLIAAGVPVKADVEQAWQDFAGWRVNYDTTLTELCQILMAPYAPWSSDRGRWRR